MTPERRAIVRDGVAVGVATGAYGVSFGALAVTSGLSVLQACALSLLMFTGASQFALIGVAGAGGSPWSGAGTAVMLGSRNALYGLRLATLLGLRGPARVAGAHLVIDESTAMSVMRGNRDDARLGFFVTGLAVFVLWNAATFAGALAGTAIGDPRSLGLDAAVGAAFLALLWPRLDTPRARWAALAAAAVAVALVPLVTAGLPVILAAGVAVLAGWRPAPRAEEEAP